MEPAAEESAQTLKWLCEEIKHGDRRGFVCDKEWLLDLTAKVDAQHHYKEMIQRVEEIFNFIQEQTRRKIQSFRIGKTSQGISRKNSIHFDGMNPDTWKMDEIASQWSAMKPCDKPYGQDGLIVLAVVTNKATPQTSFTNAADYAESLQRQLSGQEAAPLQSANFEHESKLQNYYIGYPLFVTISLMKEKYYIEGLNQNVPSTNGYTELTISPVISTSHKGDACTSNKSSQRTEKSSTIEDIFLQLFVSDDDRLSIRKEVVSVFKKFSDVINCLTIASPGPNCALCLNICVKKDHTITLQDIKDKLVTDLKLDDIYADQLDSMIQIDNNGPNFNQEIHAKMLSHQLETKFAGRQLVETSNIGYILKAENETTRPSSPAYYAITCAHSIIPVLSLTPPDYFQVRRVQINSMIELPCTLIGKEVVLFAESIIPQNITGVDYLATNHNGVQINCTYVGAKWGLFKNTHHFPSLEFEGNTYCTRATADVGVLKMQLQQRDEHTFSSRSRLDDYEELKEMEQVKNGVEFRMVSNRITLSFPIIDKQNYKIHYEYLFFNPEVEERLPVVSWSVKQPAWQNTEPEEGDSGSQVFLLRTVGPPVLLGHLMQRFISSDDNQCQWKTYVVTRYDEAVRLATPLIFKDLLSRQPILPPIARELCRKFSSTETKDSRSKYEEAAKDPRLNVFLKLTHFK